jgi:hypothetical protein
MGQTEDFLLPEILILSLQGQVWAKGQSCFDSPPKNDNAWQKADDTEEVRLTAG